MNTQIAEYSETQHAIAELRQRYQGVVVDVSTTKGLKEAKAITFELRTLRTTLEKKRKELAAPLIARKALVDDEAKRITAEIRALEEPIDAQIKAEEARKQAEELARLEAERQRVENIAKAIDEIRTVPGTLIGKPAVILEGQLAKLRDLVLDPEFYAERFREAEDALAATIARVDDQLKAQREHEAEQKRIQQEREELERMRAENERLQREADERRRADEERAAAERAEQERRDREAREVEEKRVAAIRQKINTAVQAYEDLGSRSAQFIAQRKSRFEAFLQENAGFDFQEFADEWANACHASMERIDAYLQEATQVERAEAERQAEQERQLAAERERQAEEQRRLDAERARLEKERKEAAEKAERERLANLGLREAAMAVVNYFQGEDFHSESERTGFRIPKCIGDLDTALANDATKAQPARGKRAAA